jgi:sarcosine oxidase subunit gamma
MPEAEDWLRMLPPASRFILQGGAAARAAAGLAFGVPLPEAACRANASRGRAALWLGPDEQLLLAPIGDAGTISECLGAALEGIAHSLVDVSHRQMAIAVSGPLADARLNSGCPLDLDAMEFPAGMCVRTVLGKAEVVLWRRTAEEYHLEVPRSFSAYVLGWLREAARADIR